MFFLLYWTLLQCRISQYKRVSLIMPPCSLISPRTTLNGPLFLCKFKIIHRGRKAICCLCSAGSCCSRAPDMAAQWIPPSIRNPIFKKPANKPPVRRIPSHPDPVPSVHPSPYILTMLQHLRRNEQIIFWTLKAFVCLIPRVICTVFDRSLAVRGATSECVRGAWKAQLLVEKPLRRCDFTFVKLRRTKQTMRHQMCSLPHTAWLLAWGGLFG